MNPVDELLKRALLEANLEEFQETFREADGADSSFSPAYCRRRMRLLNNPGGWYRRESRPLWKRVIRSAACVLLACTVTLGALMAASPTVRAVVLGWLRDISNGYISYEGTYDSQGQSMEEPPPWRPTWLPEGWQLSGVNTASWENANCDWYYTNGAESLRFQAWWPSSAHVGMALGPDLEGTYTTVPTTVAGRSADFYENGHLGCLVWSGADGTLFQLEGPLDQGTLERIAEGVANAQSLPLPEYQLGWLPERSEVYGRSVLREVVYESWYAADGTINHWMYAAETAPLLAVPNRTAEPETVRGMPARYWAAEKPVSDDGGITITVGGGDDAAQTYLLAGSAQESTLVWTDAETNITFLIRGVLERESILHIAESIYLEETPKVKGP